MIPLDLALVGVARFEVGVWAFDLDDGFEHVVEEDVAADAATAAAAAAAEAAAATAAVAELRLSTALLVMDRLRVTRPPGVFPEVAGEVLLLPMSAPLVGVTGVVGKAPPSVETPDRLEPFES